LVTYVVIPELPSFPTRRSSDLNYDGIQQLSRQGDVFQWGGAWLCEGGVCPTPDGRGQLLAIELPELRKPEGRFYATSRRGKQLRSEEHTSELQSRENIVCRLLL